jgi:tRNA modification GTPase
MGQFSDTIAALATPTGTSALAVLRISGSDTARMAADLAGPLPPPRQATRTDYRDRAGQLLDDVLVTFFREPASYTGEDVLEISCHGNPFIAQRILEDLLARGCRAAQPGEFTQRAFIHGRLDLSQAEAVMDLIHARSERALAAANQQLRGSLGKYLGELTEGLLGVLARVEAYIDFPDEDLPPEDKLLILGELTRLSTGTKRLLATSHYGEVLREGLKTVIVGLPNSGKSLLLNRLLGKDRALVSAEPGTTRDYLEERIIIGPHSLRLIDTAGINPTPAPLERQGMQKSLERAQEADLILWVYDSALLAPLFPVELRPLLTGPRTLLVANKSDLPASGAVPADYTDFESVRVSALTGTGMDDLQAAIVRRAEALSVQFGSEIIAINARHADALGRAQSGFDSATALLQSDQPSELVASELRSALAALGEIGGKIDNERMLDHLFATFCIGK